MSKKWMRLDNAALIFPAIRKPRWVNVFRVSATLTEPVDPKLLQEAVDALMPRFPSMYVRLRHGMFWCYLEQVDAPPRVREDWADPLSLMQSRELRTCCLRVLYFENRLAAEFFHSVTDGTGGMCYLKTLTAYYLRLKRGLAPTFSDGVLDWNEAPRAEEIEDSFLKNTGRRILNDREPNALRLRGSYVPNFLYLTTGVVPTDRLREAAHRCGVTVTVFLAAVMAKAILDMQEAQTPFSRRRPVKITVPVNLRRLYGSRTLRNFVLTLNPGVDPRMGHYSLEDLCKIIAGQLQAEATPQQMAGRIAANVTPQQLWPLRLMPLTVKNLAMRLVYSRRGESKGCINLSNLGAVRLPAPFAPFVTRLEFIVGTQRSYPNNCSVASYGGSTYINMIRNIRESELERRFFSALVELDIPVSIESNEREEPACTV